MNFRAAVLVSLVSLVALPAHAAVEPPVPVPAGHAPKLMIYLAKGGENACCPGCDHWIAIEGMIDVDAAARVKKFLRSVKGSQPPVYFHSPGGVAEQAYAIARILPRPQGGRSGRANHRRCLSGNAVRRHLRED
jgi:hypothetical protein